MRKSTILKGCVIALSITSSASFVYAQTPAAETPPAAAAPAPAVPAPEAPAAVAALTGMAAWNAIVGNTISGKKEGDDYDYYVKADGSIVWLDDGDIETGKWALEGQKVCVTFPDEDKECYKVELNGDIVNFLDDDGSGFRGTLAKGNPKKL